MDLYHAITNIDDSNTKDHVPILIRDENGRVYRPPLDVSNRNFSIRK